MFHVFKEYSVHSSLIIVTKHLCFPSWDLDVSIFMGKIARNYKKALRVTTLALKQNYAFSLNSPRLELSNYLFSWIPPDSWYGHRRIKEIDFKRWIACSFTAQMNSQLPSSATAAQDQIEVCPDSSKMSVWWPNLTSSLLEQQLRLLNTHNLCHNLR